VSLFWSVPVEEFARRDFDLTHWKTRVLELEPRAEELLGQIEDTSQLLPASYFDVVLPRFDAPRLVFIGDAAHATSPSSARAPTWRSKMHACFRRASRPARRCPRASPGLPERDLRTCVTTNALLGV